MASTAWTATARRGFICHGYRCGNPILAGEDYVRHVAFPDGDMNQGPRPVVHKICRECQAPAEMPPRRRHPPRQLALRLRQP